MSKRREPQSRVDKRRKIIEDTHVSGLASIDFIRDDVRTYPDIEALLISALGNHRTVNTFLEMCASIQSLLSDHEDVIKHKSPWVKIENTSIDDFIVSEEDESSEIEQAEEKNAVLTPRRSSREKKIIEKVDHSGNEDSTTPSIPYTSPKKKREFIQSKIVTDQFFEEKDSFEAQDIQNHPVELSIVSMDQQEMVGSVDELVDMVMQLKHKYGIVNIYFAVEMGRLIEAIVMHSIAVMTEDDRQSYLACKRVIYTPTYVNPYIIIDSQEFKDACDRVGYSKRHVMRFLKVYNITKPEYGLSPQFITHLFEKVDEGGIPMVPTLDDLDTFATVVIKLYHSQNKLKTREQCGCPSYEDQLSQIQVE